MENETASFTAKLGSVGHSKGVVIPANIIRLLKLKNQDVIKVSVAVTGISEPPSGNRGQHNKNKKFKMQKIEVIQDGPTEN